MRKIFGLKPSLIVRRTLPAWLLFFGVAASLVIQPVSVSGESEATQCDNSNLGCVALKVDMLSLTLQNIETPAITNVTPKADGKGRVVVYQVETRGSIRTSLDEFKTQANATLNDKRGWAAMNISFKEVATDGEFTLFLSEASQMTSFSAEGCDNTYSCVVGRNVVINQDRWLGATEAWNAGGGSLRDYRHMVVNHEVGHWLGHGHIQCGGPGQSAPVMQQQSMDLQGCKFNPWPLERELWSTRLGI